MNFPYFLHIRLLCTYSFSCFVTLCVVCLSVGREVSMSVKMLTFKTVHVVRFADLFYTSIIIL